MFLAPGEEVLVARDGTDVAEAACFAHARSAGPPDRRRRPPRGFMAEHTYAMRGVRPCCTAILTETR